MRPAADSRRITLLVTTRRSIVPLVGLAVHGLCSGCGLEESEAFLMEQAVCEALHTCIRHAYADQDGHTMDMELVLDRDVLTISLLDRGRPLPASAHDGRGLRTRQGRKRLAEGDAGLSVIDQVMDEVEYVSSDGVNTLRMSRRLPGPFPD